MRYEWCRSTICAHLYNREQTSFIMKSESACMQQNESERSEESGNICNRSCSYMQLHYTSNDGMKIDSTEEVYIDTFRPDVIHSTSHSLHSLALLDYKLQLPPFFFHNHECMILYANNVECIAPRAPTSDTYGKFEIFGSRLDTPSAECNAKLSPMCIQNEMHISFMEFPIS